MIVFINEITWKFFRSSNVSRCCLEGILDISAALNKDSNCETGGTTTHGKWSYGSGGILGMLNPVSWCACREFGFEQVGREWGNLDEGPGTSKILYKIPESCRDS